ncbi:MAG: hypothetical protein ACOCTT_03175 [archaeon]
MSKKTKQKKIEEKKEKALKRIKETPLRSEPKKVEQGIKKLTGKKGEVKNLGEAVDKAEKFTERLYEQGRIDEKTRNSLRAGSGEEKIIRTSEILDALDLKALKKKRKK